VVALQVDFDRLIEDLGIEHRARAATRLLMAAGMSATPAVRRGLKHRNPRVRARCCGVLDHFLDADAIPELMDNLGHDDPEVRLMAMHALGCDRCKEGSCRPAEDDVVAAAMRLLAHDPDRLSARQQPMRLGPPCTAGTTPSRRSSSLTTRITIRSSARSRVGTARADRSMSAFGLDRNADDRADR
jgi:HEAT repeats